jgi:glycosyltransferase involved in cell wall biosynthesis
MGNKLVSVCVPSYNQGLFIKEAIDSALNQTYPNIEIIIVDDCSNDDTWNIISSYDDSRINKYQNVDNIGMIANYKKVLALAKGEYFTFLCGDDVLDSNSIEVQIKLLEENKKAAFSYGLVRRIGDLDDVSKIHHDSKLLAGKYCELSLSLAQNLNYQIGTLVRKKMLPKIPISNLLYFDWFLWLQMGLLNEVMSIDTVVGYYRRHGNATTLKANKNLYKDDYNNLDLVLSEFSNQYEKKDLIYKARKKLVKRYMRITLRNNFLKNSDILFFVRKYFQF